MRPAVFHASLFLALLVGCSHEDPSDSKLVGDWDDVSALGGRQWALEFDDDGTFRADEFFKGTYEADGRQLTLHMEGSTVEYTWISHTYYVDDHILFLSAFLPDGPVDGVAGTWRTMGAMEVEGEVFPLQEELSLWPDGSGSLLSTPGDSSDITWSDIGDRIILRYEGEDGYRALYERARPALGSTEPLYRRF